jgi:hypothetical protein
MSQVILHDHFTTPKLIYRRLYYDPVSTDTYVPIIDKFRMEIGFEAFPLEPVSPGVLVRGIQTLSHLPVTIAGKEQPEIKTHVLEAGKFLAQSYLYASTRRGKEKETEPWWVAHGDLLLVIEQDPSEQVDLPDYTKFVDTLLPHHMKAAYFNVAMKKHTSLRLWILQSTERSRKYYPRLRKLRINLLRLHEEKQCLRQTLRAIKEKKFVLRQGEEISDKIQYYLNDSTRFFNKQTYQGLPHKPLFTAALDYDNIVDSEKNLLYGQLSSIRKTIFKKVETIGNHSPKPVQTINEQGKIDNSSIRLIKIKDFLVRTCNSPNDFDNLCIALQIQNIYSDTNFTNVITALVRDLERKYPDYFQRLYNALIYLKGNFKAEINALFR